MIRIAFFYTFFAFVLASVILESPSMGQYPIENSPSDLFPSNFNSDPPSFAPERADPFQQAIEVIEAASHHQHQQHVQPTHWEFQILPEGLIYRSYLAGVKESRLALHLINEKDDGYLLDGTLGGRVGVFRYGPSGSLQGFQMDVEGSAQVRLDPEVEHDVRGTDYRIGIPLTYGQGNVQYKLAWYHLSSHIGDEFQMKNPGFTRINYSRDVIVFGYSIYPMEDLRLYAEAGWAYYSDFSDPWEFQFGIDYAPSQPTGICGAPFFAVNTHLRQELNFGGNISVQFGWAWRSEDLAGRLFRAGLHYYNGGSSQFSFVSDFEHQIGFGIWYDY